MTRKEKIGIGVGLVAVAYFVSKAAGDAKQATANAAQASQTATSWLSGFVGSVKGFFSSGTAPTGAAAAPPSGDASAPGTGAQIQPNAPTPSQASVDETGDPPNNQPLDPYPSSDPPLNPYPQAAQGPSSPRGSGSICAVTRAPSSTSVPPPAPNAPAPSYVAGASPTWKTSTGNFAARTAAQRVYA